MSASQEHQGDSPPATSDYDLSQPIHPTTGLRQGLTSYGDAHFSLFLRKVFIKALGYSEDALSRPIVGIANTYSGFNPCHANVPQLLEAVKRGVQLQGGLAIDFPTISLHESFASPTSMLYRNLMSMDTEEMIRAQPVDAVVLIGGCDKTTPAQLMGAISANKPVIHLVTGPMMPGSHKGVRIGACTDCRNNWAKFRAGTIDIEDIAALNEELAPTGGTCGVMGTASTMACILVGLGMMPIKSATPAAVSSARLRMAEDAGAKAVALAKSQLKPQEILTKESFINAITVLQAIGGSTNAIVHILAIANRHPEIAGQITLETIDEVGRKTPLLVDLKPSGDNYMTDFHNAGGMPVLLQELRPLLHLDVMTVTGKTLGQELDALRVVPLPLDSPANCIRPFSSPLYPRSSLVVLGGNLAPRRAVMKASASKERRLLSHSGPAVVFANTADMAARIDEPNLEVTADSVLVLQGIGPIGNPGMPEAGLIPIPRKLAAQGVTDMLRISDGRMSGTAGGTIVLHISPESEDPSSVLGILKDGDIITCDVEARSLTVDISEEEIEIRKAARTEALSHEASRQETQSPWLARESMRGYRGLYMRSVNQADEGADFDFLTAAGFSKPSMAETRAMPGGHDETQAFGQSQEQSSQPVASGVDMASILEPLKQQQQELMCHARSMMDINMEDVQEHTTKILEVVRETQQDVASLSSEISSLRQAQLALRQQLNHDKSRYESQIEALTTTFRSELREVKSVSEVALKEARALRGEVQLLRQQMSCNPRFPQFLRLPPEIRCIIWDFALPQNLVRITDDHWVIHDKEWFGWKYDNRHAAPAVAHVCREGRSIARRTGAMIPVTKIRSASDDYSDTLPCYETEWSWFDSTRDALHLDFAIMPNEDKIHESLGGILKLTTRAKHVALKCSSDQGHWDYIEPLFDPRHFPSLERVDLIGAEHGFTERTDLVLEARLFWLSKWAITIDVDDSEDFLDTLRLHHSSPLINQIERELTRLVDSNYWHIRSQIRTGFLNWSDFKKGLARKWFAVQYLWSPLGGSEGSKILGERRIGASHDWMKTMKPKMPSFHRVVLVKLCR
ncbi:hypothetical protein SUNI508_00507 [Seiridium unicorne]|uniref:Dihydroxy-acid dehydratase n=1 Tax=Seiridium unicorne TaxID=138068 RepID=A0ABR2V6X9_9PEZI